MLMEPALWQRSAKLLERGASVAGAGARSHESGHQSARAARPHASLASINSAEAFPLKLSGALSRMWLQSPTKKNRRSEAGGRPKKKNGFSSADSRPARREKPTHASPMPRPRSPAIKPFPLPAGSSDASWKLDLPDAVREGTSSANVRPVAWFELNKFKTLLAPSRSILSPGLVVPTGSLAISPIFAFTPGMPKKHVTKRLLSKIICAGRCLFASEQSAKGEPEFRFRSNGRRMTESRVSPDANSGAALSPDTDGPA